MKEKNAIIRSVSLGYEDHGILTAFVHLDYGGSGQSFGGYCLDRPMPKGAEGGKRRPRDPSDACGFFIARTLDVVGVDSWEKLEGQSVRVRCDGEFGAILALGNFLEDRWFYPRDEFKVKEREQ